MVTAESQTKVAEKPVATAHDSAPAFTLEPLRRVMKQAGAPRVSDDAARALAEALERKTSVIVAEAAKIAAHSNRKTVLAEDVKLARKVIEEMK